MGPPAEKLERASGFDFVEAYSNSLTNDTEAFEPIVDDIPLDEKKVVVQRKLRTFEICCGSAGLSAALAERRFDTIAIDSKRNRHFSKHAVTSIDLLVDGSVDLIKAAIDEGEVALIFFAPPWSYELLVCTDLRSRCSS